MTIFMFVFAFWCHNMESVKTMQFSWTSGHRECLALQPPPSCRSSRSCPPSYAWTAKSKHLNHLDQTCEYATFVLFSPSFFAFWSIRKAPSSLVTIIFTFKDTINCPQNKSFLILVLDLEISSMCCNLPLVKWLFGQWEILKYFPHSRCIFISHWSREK